MLFVTLRFLKQSTKKRRTTFLGITLKKLLILFVLMLTALLNVSAAEFIKTGNLPDIQKYYFNRNAISDFEIVDETIIALTESGNILQFDSDLNFTGELTDSLAYSCLGCIVNQELLIGREDGSIFMLNPKTLERGLYAKVDSEPLLITMISDSKGLREDVWVVYYQPLRNFVRNDSCWEKSTFDDGISIFKNLFINISDTTEVRTSSCRGIRPCFLNYCKSNNRIYYGTTGNEFGSCYGYYDIQNKSFLSKDTSGYGSYGIDEFQNGKILSFGGNSHLGLLSNFITELNDTNESVIYSERFLGLYNPATGIIKDSVRLHGKPKHPISIILNDYDKKKYIVFTSGEVFEIDYEFRKWNKIFDYKHLYQFGIPTFTKSKLLSTGNYLCSTKKHGFLTLKPGILEISKINNQVENDFVGKIITAYDQLVFIPNWVGINPFCIDKGSVKFIEPYSKQLYPDFNIYEYMLFSWKDSLYSVVQGTSSVDSTIISAIVSGKPETRHNVNWFSMYPIVMDKLLCAKISAGKICVYRNFTRCITSPIVGSNQYHHEYWDFKKALNSEGPPWLLNNYRGNSFYLNYNEDLSEFECRFNPLLYKSDTLKIKDGTQFGEEVLLLANKALFTYHIAKDSLELFELAPPDSRIEHIEIDNSGRLWLAGKGLWSYDFTTKELKKISSVGNNSITAISRRPLENGVAVFVRSRGLFFVE
ncbi:MAG: hypothetical protein PF588_08620 [Candidatus Kapabacteria bacterium]|nr:hypothetical protein [Candidatus Kapabacteria bacterium]